MKIQKSAEDYLETVLILSRQNGSVRAVDIANALNFSKPSVSIAMKNLRENGYVELDGNGCIRLCDKGREIAERIYERHTVLTDWLTGLGVDTQKLVRRDAQHLRERRQQRDVRHRSAALPLGDRRDGKVQVFRKLLLRHILPAARVSDVFSDFHHISPFGRGRSASVVYRITKTRSDYKSVYLYFYFSAA